MFPCASGDVESRCISRKSRKRPLPPPFSVPNAARNRSRSAGVSVCASLRIRTVTGLLPSTPRLPAPRASIVVSPSATLGRPNSPATKNRTGAPLTGRSNWSVGVPRCVRVVANLTRPPVPTLRSVTLTGPAPTGLSSRARASTGAHVMKLRPTESRPGRINSTVTCAPEIGQSSQPTVADRSHRAGTDPIAAATRLAIRHGFPSLLNTMLLRAAIRDNSRHRRLRGGPRPGPLRSEREPGGGYPGITADSACRCGARDPHAHQGLQPGIERSLATRPSGAHGKPEVDAQL